MLGTSPSSYLARIECFGITVDSGSPRWYSLFEANLHACNVFSRVYVKSITCKEIVCSAQPYGTRYTLPVIKNKVLIVTTCGAHSSS